jgi:RimJ/RimL family protein N-acetyltransferase
VHEIGTGSYVGLSKLTHISSGTAELGYALLPDFWGKGYGTEISQRMLELAYSIPRLHTLEAYIHPDNTASQHILEKCGFQFWKGGMKNNMLTSIFVMKIIRETAYVCQSSHRSPILRPKYPALSPSMASMSIPAISTNHFGRKA